MWGGGNCDNSNSSASKDTTHRDKSSGTATFWLTFYGNLNFRFLVGIELRVCHQSILV